MQKLVLITGFGGINSAGRSSAHQGFKRLVLDSLSFSDQQHTYRALAQLMGLDADQHQAIRHGSLVREFDHALWDAKAVPFHQPFTDEQGTPCWRLSHKVLAVQSAGQLPKGFDPAALYPSNHHPRGLQMAIFGASDALGQFGVPWSRLRQRLAPDEIAVYAGSAMAQLDDAGHGGMLKAALLGKRSTAKQCALGFSEMSADFINAYVLGNLGSTGSVSGACASFLYNLKAAWQDIQAGRARLALVGVSEAPLVPEIIEGYHGMTALASTANLRKLDGLSDDQQPDYRRASRPFGHNCGFTIAESAQFVVLCDEALTLELGLTVYAALGEVFVHADGFKKSISNPGVGNYLTLAKALKSAERVLGKSALRNGSYVQAHGSSTPANRTTESAIFSELAGVFGIENWPVTAVKAQLGHSIGAAAGDQVMASLGSWAYGMIPGIISTERLAEDVEQRHLNFLLKHHEFAAQDMPLSFINAKGFGGNNASTYLISPHRARQMLAKRSGKALWQRYLHNNEQVMEKAQQWDEQSCHGSAPICYQFGDQVLQPNELSLSAQRIAVKGWAKKIRL